MALLRIDGPDVEPVSVTEAKAHLRVDGAEDDGLVAGLITAARAHLEQLLGRAMIAQTWIEVRDFWPKDGSGVRLSLSPVREVIEIRVVDDQGAANVVPDTDYFVDFVTEPARLLAIGTAAWPQPKRPANGIEIEFTAGYGDAPGDVPQPLRQAILLLVAHWYERREPVIVGAPVMEVPNTVAGLISPYRQLRVA